MTGPHLLTFAILQKAEQETIQCIERIFIVVDGRYNHPDEALQKKNVGVVDGLLANHTERSRSFESMSHRLVTHRHTYQRAVTLRNFAIILTASESVKLSDMQPDYFWTLELKPVGRWSDWQQCLNIYWLLSPTNSINLEPKSCDIGKTLKLSQANKAKMQIIIKPKTNIRVQKQQLATGCYSAGRPYSSFLRDHCSKREIWQFKQSW